MGWSETNVISTVTYYYYYAPMINVCPQKHRVFWRVYRKLRAMEMMKLLSLLLLLTASFQYAGTVCLLTNYCRLTGKF